MSSWSFPSHRFGYSRPLCMGVAFNHEVSRSVLLGAQPLKGVFAGATLVGGDPPPSLTHLPPSLAAPAPRLLVQCFSQECPTQNSLLDYIGCWLIDIHFTWSRKSVNPSLFFQLFSSSPVCLNRRARLQRSAEPSFVGGTIVSTWFWRTRVPEGRLWV